MASKIRRKELVFDAHEMFPEMPEVTNRPFVKKVWTKIEDRIFPHLKHSMTVCQSIADEYKQKYGINMRVVRNIPLAHTQPVTQSPIDKKGKKVLLYQGSVNVGRGIERIIDAMPYLPQFMFYVVGTGDLLEALKAKVNQLQLNEQVIFTGQVPFERLPTYTAAADIGINLLENIGLNYYYALPNRIFDYMRAHVPVLAVDFPEIRRIVAHYNIGTIIDHFEPAFIAKTIQEMSAQEQNIQGFEQANAELTWEKEATNLPFYS
ncbi:hypothetical protein FACS1894176_11230 [Bacteroidia bacterium]|nr:hypothetical protein FACS1894176_11230 [Bacteroidia bacterium]